MPEIEIRNHNPRTIAAITGVSERWACIACRRVLGRRTTYNLTDAEARRVLDYLEKNRRGQRKASV